MTTYNISYQIQFSSHLAGNLQFFCTSKNHTFKTLRAWTTDSNYSRLTSPAPYTGQARLIRKRLIQSCHLIGTF